MFDDLDIGQSLWQLLTLLRWFTTAPTTPTQGGDPDETEVTPDP